MNKTLISVIGLSFGLQLHAAEPAGLNDKQIAEVLITLDEGEIKAGEIAHDHAQTAAVQEFAKMMVQQHKDNKKATSDLASKAKIGTKSSDLSKSLETEAKTMNADLKKSDKTAFDKAYVAEQISMHQKALSTLRDTLIPGAQNAELKEWLQKTSTAVSEHLEHAKSLQAKL